MPQCDCYALRVPVGFVSFFKIAALLGFFYRDFQDAVKSVPLSQPITLLFFPLKKINRRMFRKEAHCIFLLLLSQAVGAASQVNRRSAQEKTIQSK